MASISGTITATRHITAAFDELGHKADSLASVEAAKLVVEEARRRAPASSPAAPLKYRRARNFRGIRLRNSIRYYAGGRKVGSKLDDLARFVHLGTRYQRAQPFMLDAINAKEPEIRRLYAEELQLLADRVAKKADAAAATALLG